ncbi:hypothetical protein CC2G_010990 [Coprinopsis cinerea AmutBmut pab1-1]|nr:hypothetical protein CC2G_010990 [Coprinopsis cinerea AmutBmut pab1-1]
MTTLVTGGGSKVGSHLARLLKDAGREVIFGSRSGRVPAGFPSIQLDWDDPSTFTNPFTSSDLKKPITSVYLMAPITDLHAAPKIIPFVETAKQHGVKRFVYLSATIADRHNDSGGLGELPGYFEDNGFDYVALRPTWFQDNLETDYAEEVRTKDTLTNAITTGRVPFVSTEDVARAAFEAIVNEKIPFARRDPFIIGPDLYSFSDIAELLSSILGRPIKANVVTWKEMKDFYIQLYGGEYMECIEWLWNLDKGIQAGSEEHRHLDPAVYIGKTSLREWVTKRKHIFEKV